MKSWREQSEKWEKRQKMVNAYNFSASLHKRLWIDNASESNEPSLTVRLWRASLKSTHARVEETQHCNGTEFNDLLILKLVRRQIFASAKRSMTPRAWPSSQRLTNSPSLSFFCRNWTTHTRYRRTRTEGESTTLKTWRALLDISTSKSLCLRSYARRITSSRLDFSRFNTRRGLFW